MPPPWPWLPALFPRIILLKKMAGVGQPHSHRGVLSGHTLFPGDEKTQSRTPSVGKDLQHRASPPVARLPYPAAVPAAELISKIRNEKCHPSTGRVQAVDRGRNERYPSKSCDRLNASGRKHAAK